jgi:hypothetical protein
VWELRHQADAATLSGWAGHFRNHYCLDTQIDQLRNGTGYSRRDYLLDIKFPDATEAPGPSIRAGDFSEVLVADYLEYIRGFWVPRTRYANKVIRNESTKGCDIVGIRLQAPGVVSPKDVLVIFESKAQFSGKKGNSLLQKAIDGSAKDVARKAETLNAMKQRFLDTNQVDNAKVVERFQNPNDHPYIEIAGAAAIMSADLYNAATISTADAKKHPNKRNLRLVVISGADLMKLTHHLYQRAADEA